MTVTDPALPLSAVEVERTCLPLEQASMLPGVTASPATTGAAGSEWASQGVPNSILLTKPFAPAQLITAVSQLLNAAAPPAPP